MDEDVSWYGNRPLPRPQCVRRGPSSPRERGTASPPLFSADVYRGHGHPSQLLPSFYFTNGSINGVIIIIAVHHKNTNKTPRAVLCVMEVSCPILAGIELVPLAGKGNESAVGLGLLLLKTACTNKLADFTAPFMKHLASKMQSNVFGTMTLPGPTGDWRKRSLHTDGICISGKSHKMLRGRFVRVGKCLTNVQILGCQFHKNAFGGRAPPGPAGAAIALSPPFRFSGYAHDRV